MLKILIAAGCAISEKMPGSYYALKYRLQQPIEIKIYDIERIKAPFIMFYEDEFYAYMGQYVFRDVEYREHCISTEEWVKYVTVIPAKKRKKST